MIYTFYKQYGNKILLRYKKGKETITTEFKDYRPSLYTVDTAEVSADVNTSNFVSIYGYPLKKLTFDSIKSANQFVSQYSGVDNFRIEGNSRFDNQFIIELLEGKSPQYNESDMRGYIIDIEVAVPDDEGFPEPDVAQWPISAITTYDTQSKIFYVFGLAPNLNVKWTKSLSPAKIQQLNIEYVHCDSEEELVNSYISFFSLNHPDFTSGWNSETFDMPYIVTRFKQIVGPKVMKILSPYGIVNERISPNEFGKPTLKVDIIGIPHLDYIELYKKHIFTPRESFKLGFIAQEELHEDKLDYKGSLIELYQTDFQRYIDYNIIDVNLVRLLDEKLKLFAVTFALAYYTLGNYQDTLGTVKIWEELAAKYLYTVNKVPLFKQEKGVERPYEGAYVHPVAVGKHKWTFAIDLNSLYPHNEIQYNIGVETHVPFDQLPADVQALASQSFTVDDLVLQKVDTSCLTKYNLAMTPNKQFYRKDVQSFFGAIKEELYAMRKVFKKQMLKAQQELVNIKQLLEHDPTSSALLESYHNKENEVSFNNNMQMCMKILLNSGYGAVGNAAFLYYKVENAEAITMAGQLINKWTCHRLTDLLRSISGNTDRRYVIAGDTDSAYVSIEDIVEMMIPDYKTRDVQFIVDKIDEFVKTVVDPEIKTYCADLVTYMQAYKNKMVWEREIIAESMVFIAKKRYLASVWDNEGVRYREHPKFKFVGVESVRSSTPAWASTWLEECYKVVLNGDEQQLQHRFSTMQDEFKQIDADVIAIPTGVNGLEKWASDETLFKKGAPAHVKAALLHNKLLVDLNLKHLNPILSGSKIKYVQLKEPNPLRADAIAFNNDELPVEFNLHQYIDRDGVFEKSFSNPLQIVLNSVGWTTEHVITLDSFFN